MVIKRLPGGVPDMKMLSKFHNLFHTISGKFILLCAALIIIPLFITSAFYIRNYDRLIESNVVTFPITCLRISITILTMLPRI